MRVRDVMTRDVRTCGVQEDLASIGRTMIEADCGVLPVVGTSGELAGVLTDRDVCAFLCEWDRKPSTVQAAQVMRREVWACRPEQGVDQALDIMQRHRVRRLPVLDEDDRLVGILSLDDIALRSRPVVTSYDGPADADVAETLRAVSHAVPRGRVPL
jgi:CBS domain-containing protein